MDSNSTSSPSTDQPYAIYPIPHHNGGHHNHTSSSHFWYPVPYHYICKAERWMMQRYYRTGSNGSLPALYHLNLLPRGYYLDGLSNNSSTCWNLPNSHILLRLATASGCRFHRSHSRCSPLLWLNHSVHALYGVFFHQLHIGM